jgi:hypothetical protein
VVPFIIIVVLSNDMMINDTSVMGLQVLFEGILTLVDIIKRGGSHG